MTVQALMTFQVFTTHLRASTAFCEHPRSVDGWVHRLQVFAGIYHLFGIHHSSSTYSFSGIYER